ncbi:MAG: hypothetical protein GDA49_04555 [Rhodospirillales bacterium]|nr:hypothetical protein [Rhodospirillales bacterium]
MPPFLSHVAENFPELDVAYDVTLPDDTLDALARGRIDVAVFPRAPPEQHVFVRVLFEDDLVACRYADGAGDQS